MAPQMPHACLSCATKKRSCDKAFPRCSRCAGSKSNQHCVYRGPFNDRPLSFDNGYIVWSSFSAAEYILSPPNRPTGPSALPGKSSVNCQRCREAKRACSKDLPICSRCKRRNTSCHYEVHRDYALDQRRQSMPAHAWPFRDSPASISENDNSFSEDPELWNTRQSLMLQVRTSPLALAMLQFKPRYPVPERDNFAKLIYYYIEACCFPPQYVLQNSLMAHVHTVLVSRALADPCLFLTVLFAASAHRDWIQGTRHTVQTLYHQSQVLNILRERLKQTDQISYEMVASAIVLTFYSMSGHNTASARIHKSGVLQMLAKNQHRGSEFEALTALANLVLLGLSVAVNEEPPFVLPNTSKQIGTFTFFESGCMPSSLLRRAVARVSEDQKSLLTSDTVASLQRVIYFIVNSNHVSVTKLCTLHGETLWTKSQESSPKSESEEESPSITTKKAGKIINRCCRLAIGIFWSIFRSLPPSQEKRGPSATPSNPILGGSRRPLEELGSILHDLDLLTWNKHDPEAYLWICFTAAAACEDAASRVPFVAIAPPLLTATDTKELPLARECWRYYKWLTGFAALRAEGRASDMA
ncbi:hypothetical protein BJY01DRAFT_230280 [Aspergillus pseudoustus]|uniref:Zn(2)-C6 fungal-type domain-containing protein n=1 Tax=Aspergillus pseudoustus TaxID=1810923 RepID=A0ABR4IBX6_9EURO